jgi:hypothetical protein
MPQAREVNHGEDHMNGEADDLANESANVIEFNSTGNVFEKPPSQLASRSSVHPNAHNNPFRLVNASKINQINQSGFHQR